MMEIPNPVNMDNKDIFVKTQYFPMYKSVEKAAMISESKGWE